MSVAPHLSLAYPLPSCYVLATMISDPGQLLAELLEAVALASGRLFPCTLDQVGVDAAKAAIRNDMSPALGRTASDTAPAMAAIREVLRLPPQSYRLLCGGVDLGAVDAWTVPRIGELVDDAIGTLKVVRVRWLTPTVADVHCSRVAVEPELESF